MSRTFGVVARRIGYIRHSLAALHSRAPRTPRTFETVRLGQCCNHAREHSASSVRRVWESLPQHTTLSFNARQTNFSGPMQMRRSSAIVFSNCDADWAFLCRHRLRDLNISHNRDAGVFFSFWRTHGQRFHSGQSSIQTHSDQKVARATVPHLLINF